jgi:4-hydroxybenzoate polyprenyltransferase
MELCSRESGIRRRIAERINRCGTMISPLFSIGSVSHSFLRTIIYSNLYLAIGGVVIVITAQYLADTPIAWEPAFICFSATMFIYTANRFTDRDEDTVNLPLRRAFIDRFGIYLLGISSILYCGALVLAWFHNLSTLLVALLPLGIGLLYSHYRLKRVYFLKNVLIGVGWSSSVLIVATYAEIYDPFIFLFAAFISLAFTINTIIFDIKDIKGDFLTGIESIPVKMGVRKARRFCFYLFLLMIGLWMCLVRMQMQSILLLPFLAYIGYYISISKDTDNLPWWFYGGIVDGEFYMLSVVIGYFLLY